MARAVAQDMESIFGAQLRPMAPVVPRPEPEVLSRSRNWARLAAVGLLSVTAVAGVLAGKSVTASPAARSVSTAPARAPSIPPAASVAAPAVAQPAAIPASEPRPQVAAEMAAPAMDTTRIIVAAPAQPAPAPRPRYVAAPDGEPAVAPGPPAPAPVTYREPPAPAPTRIVVDCDRDPQACFAARLEWADRRTGEAFEDAAAAGVRPKTLREYRSEWNRARGEADSRPGEALRILAMITHDLKQLTNDADAR